MPAWDERRVGEIERRLTRLDEIKANVQDVQTSVAHIEERMDRHGKTLAAVSQQVEEVHINTSVMNTQLATWIEHNRWLMRSVAAIVLGALVTLLVYAVTSH